MGDIVKPVSSMDIHILLHFHSCDMGSIVRAMLGRFYHECGLDILLAEVLHAEKANTQPENVSIPVRQNVFPSTMEIVKWNLPNKLLTDHPGEEIVQYGGFGVGLHCLQIWQAAVAVAKSALIRESSNFELIHNIHLIHHANIV